MRLTNWSYFSKKRHNMISWIPKGTKWIMWSWQCEVFEIIMIILKSEWNQKHDSPEINSWSFSHITHEIKAWNLHDADVFIFLGSRQGDQNWPKWSHRLFLFAYSPKFLSFLSIFICASFRHFDSRLFDIRHLTQLAILTRGFLLKPSQPLFLKFYWCLCF